VFVSDIAVEVLKSHVAFSRVCPEARRSPRWTARRGIRDKAFRKRAIQIPLRFGPVAVTGPTPLARARCKAQIGASHHPSVQNECGERAEGQVEDDVRPLAAREMEQHREHQDRHEAGPGGDRQPRQHARRRRQDDADRAEDPGDASEPPNASAASTCTTHSAVSISRLLASRRSPWRSRRSDDDALRPRYVTRFAWTDKRDKLGQWQTSDGLRRPGVEARTDIRTQLGQVSRTKCPKDHDPFTCGWGQHIGAVRQRIFEYEGPAEHHGLRRRSREGCGSGCGCRRRSGGCRHRRRGGHRSRRACAERNTEQARCDGAERLPCLRRGWIVWRAQLCTTTTLELGHFLAMDDASAVTDPVCVSDVTSSPWRLWASTTQPRSNVGTVADCCHPRSWSRSGRRKRGSQARGSDNSSARSGRAWVAPAGGLNAVV